AIIDTDRPVLERFHGVLRSSAHGGIVFVSFMMVALFAARFASYVTPSRATTVLLKVTLLGSCAPIRSSDALAFAIAFFIAASRASGVCCQSGIVNTAFAFVAAARKSSTVFIWAAETPKFDARRKSRT